MNLKSFWSGLFLATDGRMLGVFRAIFGFFMILESLYYLRIDLPGKGLLAPKILFRYDYLDFIQPLPAPLLHAVPYLMLGSAVFICIGWFTRVAAASFFVLNTYLLLLDKFIFNNHIYLFSLLALLFVLMDTDQCFSMRRSLSKKIRDNWVPAWNVRLLQLQIAIVYFYGGITKINPDWLLRHEPVITHLRILKEKGLAGEFITDQWAILFFTYGGLLFDLIIPLLLFHKTWRWYALPAVFFFNIVNHITFDDIGYFPLIMLATTLLFFSFEDFTRWGRVNQKKRQKIKETEAPHPIPISKPLKGFLVFYVIFQLLFPFRHWLLPNEVDWTSVAQRFSWRMKVQTRKIDEMKFTVSDGPGGQAIPVNELAFIHTQQREVMGTDPRMILDFAKFLEKESIANYNVRQPVVKATVKVIYNGRPEQLFVNPDFDLAKATYSPFERMEFVMPISPQ